VIAAVVVNDSVGWKHGPEANMRFLVAFGLASVTVIIHALGTLEAIAHLSRIWQRRTVRQRPLASEVQIVRVVSFLLLLHLIEAGIWGSFFVVAGVLPDLDTAVYFSLTTYTTVGYGDVVLPVSWRLLGPFESAVGILMFGWSTGIMVTAITRIYGNRLRLQIDLASEENESHE
jgi:voltage-gated potassium channel